MINVVGIGLANIDLVSHIEESFLSDHGLVKGHSKKLNMEQFFTLRDELPNPRIEAGGCVGNMLCGLDKTNIKTTFFGKIGTDAYTKIYRNSFKKYNVLYPIKNADEPSSQCIVLITPDGERTFVYIRGASWTLSPDDIYFGEIAQSDIIYTEIYALAFGMKTGLWPNLINHMRNISGTMAIKIIDHEYTDLYKTTLFGLAEERILTLIVGNKSNICSLTERDTVDGALNVLSKWNCATLLTDGVNNAYYNKGQTRYVHAITPIENPLNTHGAGDQFVAGFLEKWLFYAPISECMKNAEEHARKVIMNDSPRPPL